MFHFSWKFCQLFKFYSIYNVYAPQVSCRLCSCCSVAVFGENTAADGISVWLSIAWQRSSLWSIARKQLHLQREGWKMRVMSEKPEKTKSQRM